MRDGGHDGPGPVLRDGGQAPGGGDDGLGGGRDERETHLFLTFWGLHAFRRSVIGTQLPMSAGYGETADAEQMGKLMRDKGVPPWPEVLRDAKDIGDVRVHACAMTADLMDLTKDDLDPMVDDVIGVATFVELSTGARTLFI